MANDIFSTLTISPVTHEQWKQLAATFQEDHKGFLATFLPEPDWATTPDEDGELPVEEPCLVEEDKTRSVFESTGKQDERWYWWRHAYWGSKWDIVYPEVIGNEASTTFEAKFATANGKLNEKCLEDLSLKFPGSVFTLKYHDHGCTFGVTVSVDGMSVTHESDCQPVSNAWYQLINEVEIPLIGLGEGDDDDDDDIVFESQDHLFDLIQSKIAEGLLHQISSPDFELREPATKLLHRMEREKKAEKIFVEGNRLFGAKRVEPEEEEGGDAWQTIQRRRKSSMASLTS